MIHSPVLLDKSNLKEIARLRPSSIALDMKVNAISQADMTIVNDEQQLLLGDYVRIYTQQGDMGVFVVDGIEPDYTTGQGCRYSLSHAIGELQKSIMFEPKDDNATPKDMSVSECIKKILNKQNLWKIGSCDFDDQYPYDMDGQSLYELLEYACSPLEDFLWTYNMASLPFKLNIKKKPTTASCEMRLNRNLSNIKVTVDTSDMFTRLYPVGYGALIIDSDKKKAYIEKNTDKYGVIERTETNNDINDVKTLKSWGKALLNRHCKPIVSVTATGLELSESTGEPLDSLLLGTLCNIPLLRNATQFPNAVAHEMISEVQWVDLIATPEIVNVTISSERQDVASILKAIKKSSGGGARASTKDEERIKKAELIVDEQGGQITAWAGEVKDLGDAVKLIEGSYSIQNAQEIIDAVGKVTVIGGRVEAVEGAVQDIRENSITDAVGRITYLEGEIKDIEGSAIWRDKNNIATVVGTMSFDKDGNLIIKTGGGIKIQKDTQQIGIFDENNLTAGFLVQKINNSTTARIKADRIELDGTTIADRLYGSNINVGDLTSTGVVDAATLRIVNTSYFGGDVTAMGTVRLQGDAYFANTALGNALKGVSWTQIGDNITLTFQRFVGDDIVVNFNKASALSYTASFENKRIGVTDSKGHSVAAFTLSGAEKDPWTKLMGVWSTTQKS